MCLTAFGPHHSFPPEWRQATPRKGKDGKHDGRNTDKLQKQAHPGFHQSQRRGRKLIF
jgi:hypothetical protein